MKNLLLQGCNGFLIGCGLFVLTLATPANAQTRLGGTPLSLNEALETGLKNRYDLQANQVSLALSENSIQKNRSGWLPDIAASGSVRYNTQLQTTVIPAGLFPGSTEAQRIAFGTKNSTVFALDLTQPLYRPQAKTDRAILENNKALTQEQNGQQQTSVKIRIAEAYLNVLLRDLQRTIARADAQRYVAYFAISEGKYKLGALLESDYLNGRLDLQNSQLTAQKAEQTYRQAQATLCYELNIPTDTTLVLTDRIDPQQVAAYQLEANPTERTELRQARLRQEGYALQSRNVLNLLRPTVSFFANYSTQFLQNDFRYFSQPWSPFNYLGVQFRLPLTGQFTRKTDLNTYRLYQQQTALNLKQTEADIANEIDKGRDELTNAARNLQSTKASLDLSTQLHQLQQEQYRLGTRLYSQVLDTEKSLQTAEQNYLEAAYNFLVARLTYEKAIGTY
ncbi:TolC family protein [Fibrella aquatilis]|uniref:TolC family protein n=1 Tax=Fibrella aquatilis TaxID=2817059 RepID=A0A939G8E1_9BACT|nr:TolC family protein [Fibrella aquatilis]MBO0931956.1 TolC family protein [Fibrella aquatilis]